ncbi:MAG: phosphoenolpyruvate carboxylase, partial [Gemmatimonadota bacterium]|nr:phosphoenolpyruvate carboxylase [Gemmatimonadota bacterium]
AEDLIEAQRRGDDVLGPAAIPVVPLFELPDVLVRAPTILEEAWRDEAFRQAVGERGYLEVMLGYSDTAKRMGMLGSRVALHDAMRAIGAWAESEDVDLLFFHGHGGSVGRGGGRIEDLAATWPPRARTPYKYTLQGEMVERTLATPEILRSLVEKVAEVQEDPPPYEDVGSLARELAEASNAAFEARVGSEPFLRLLERATPYGRLQALTIGSRPASRGGGGLEDLRAIPWVLCWTQTRLLLHGWLGVGEAWRRRRDDADIEARLDEAREADPLFRSYARLLSFTMAKTEPVLWRRYRDALAHDVPAPLIEELDEDYEAAIDLACRAVGADSLLPERPWLEESIRYRAPMIHPLNLIQIELLGRPEWDEAETHLFRETVTGIAAGMLTTG